MDTGTSSVKMDICALMNGVMAIILIQVVRYCIHIPEAGIIAAAGGSATNPAGMLMISG